MKPSEPGLLFAGRVLITVSISVLVMGLLRFSVSSWFSFGKLYFSFFMMSLSGFGNKEMMIECIKFSFI